MFTKNKLKRYVTSLVFCTFAMPSLAAISVYGPGGPAPAMNEVAKQFEKETGIEVNISAGPTPQWADKAKLNADLFYSGSEAMMSDLEKMFSTQMVKNSIEPVYLRPAAILVRKGNPKNIQNFHDLAQPNLKVLVTHGAGQVGMWEDIAGRTGNIELTKNFRKNIATYAPNTGVAKKSWEQDDSYDAWLVFNIWGVHHPELGQIIPIEPELVVYRDMGIALTQRGIQNVEVKRFVEFLKSAQGEKIFKSFGWTK